MAVQADVSREAEVARLFDTTFTRFGQLDILGLPEDIADVVALLCTDDARWITGQNVRANGRTI